MRMFKTLLAAVSLATAFVAAPASATTIFLDEAHYAPPAIFGGISFTPLGLSFGGEAGRFAFTGHDTANNNPFFALSYCLDFTKTLSGGNFALGPISSFVSNVTKQRQLAALLRNTNPLFALTTDVNEKSRIAAAVALSVWEIVFESGTTSYSVASGNFSTFGDFVSLQGRADSYLNGVLTGLVGDASQLGSLVNLSNQSQVFLAPTVPEPATWLMLIAGFGLTGAALRRRKTSAALTA